MLQLRETIPPCTEEVFSDGRFRPPLESVVENSVCRIRARLDCGRVVNEKLTSRVLRRRWISSLQPQCKKIVFTGVHAWAITITTQNSQRNAMESDNPEPHSFVHHQSHIAYRRTNCVSLIYLLIFALRVEITKGKELKSMGAWLGLVSPC